VRTERSSWPAAIVIAAAFFAATAPTLAWLEFSSTMENLVTASAMEIRRDHVWLLPTLEGEPRIAKPPLAAWIAAAGIRPSTFAHLDDPDPYRRELAYRALAWDIRWPALLSSCLMLLAIFDLGKTIAGAPIGLLAMIVAGSSLFLLRFGRQATTDVQLALWVSIANAALARLLVHGPSWRTAIVAGIAIGLALMSKGPVALVQTLLPACVFAGWRRQTRIKPSHVGLLLLIMFLVGGAWFAYVFATVPHVSERWKIEVLGNSGNDRADPPWAYLLVLAYMLPWSVAMAHGLVWTAVEAWRARRREMMLPRSAEGMILVLLLFILPIAVMTFFPDRKDRYLLPMVGPAAVLASRSLSKLLELEPQEKFVRALHWLMIAAIGVGWPIVGATLLKRSSGLAWYPRGLAVCAAVFLGMLIAIAIQQSRNFPFLLITAPAIVMLVLAPLFFVGYRDTPQGRSDLLPLANLIRFVAPDAEVYNWRKDANKRGDVSLAIYLNRPSIWTPDPARLPASARSQVIVTIIPTRGPDAQPPSDWIFLNQCPRDKNEKYISFVRPPTLLRSAVPTQP
jgi:4-amino-4-deoxy-L-arabinose transferase-like glycosyltransferase